ncbi:MAG: DUF4118 domain-containing protein [Eubacteriales bacterium]|nr:DUF4118 domain-containing protein [Eubacteriales bacterium]
MQTNRKNKSWKQFRITRRNIVDCLGTAAILIVATGVSVLLVRWTDSSANVTAVFTLAVLLVARMTDGYSWGILASVVGVVAVNFAFTAPFYKLNFTTPGYPVIFFTMLLISVFTSASTGGMKKQAQRARAGEQHIQKLYDFSQQLSSAQDAQSMVRLLLEYLNEMLERPVLYLRDADSMTEGKQIVCGEVDEGIFGSAEYEAAAACFRGKRDTGAGTNTQTEARFRYIPMLSGDTMSGVMGILWCGSPLDEELLEHIRAILVQTGISLERYMLTEERNRAAMAADREKIRSNLLRSISHDLRTPLTGIIGASAAIVENGDDIGTVETKKLAADIHEDAEWLLRMVENLLSVTRVSQVGTLKKSEEAAEEVISAAVVRCKKRYPQAQVRVQLPEEMLFVPMDVTLIVQVLINLIENAIRYAGTPIDISLCRKDDCAEFTVRDFGPGIAEEKRDTLFIAPQTQPDNRRGGLGIGLTLCHSIITAHGGKIYTMNHPDGGAQFIFTLPLEENNI